MPRWIVLLGSHSAVLSVGIGVGFALGIYLLPILTAPKGPDESTIAQMTQSALFQTTLTRDLKGSDFLHWGDGTISLTAEHIVHDGSLAPGPDYKLYLVNTFVEDESEFLKVKQGAQLIGDVNSFDGFILDVPAGVDITAYSTVLVWCEAFGEFITAGRYQ